MKRNRYSRLDRPARALVVALAAGVPTLTPLEGSEGAEGRAGQITRGLPGSARGARTVIATSEASAADMVSTLLSPRPGPVVVQNVNFQGASIAGGTFSGGVSVTGIPIGVILSTGNIASVIGGTTIPAEWNEYDWTTTQNGQPGDTDVAGISSCSVTHDAAVLTFDITSTDKDRILKFYYSFGSEEYNEWVTSSWDDAFGVWVRVSPGGFKRSIALMPAATGFGLAKPRPVTTHNVNKGVQGWDGTRPNAAYYNNNDCDDRDGPGSGPKHKCAAPLMTELDGLTTVHSTRPHNLRRNTTYTVKIAIADARDQYLDSVVFIKGTAGVSCYRCAADRADNECVDGVPEDECVGEGAYPSGELCIDRDSPCDPPEPTGACCVNEDVDTVTTICVSTTAASCYAGGGVYAGNGTSCGVTGACCFDDGACLEMTYDCCAVAGGAYQTDGSTCSPTGACHIGTRCTVTTDDCCTGDYQGDDTECDLGACCGAGGSCSVTDPSSCSGTYQGEGTECAGDHDDTPGDDVCQVHTPPQICGNNDREGEEYCDGSDDSNCVGQCRADCTCPNMCGNREREGDEECDVTDDDACPGLCLEDCTCSVIAPLPASYPHNRAKNRYISFDPNKAENDGVNVAFKVTLTFLGMRSCADSGWPCRTNDDCRVCSESGDPCWTAPLHCPAGETCELTGAMCVNDQAGSVGMSWWVGPEHPTTGVHLMVTEVYRKVSADWSNPVIVSDCELVPAAGYEARAVLAGSGPPEIESDPLEIKTAEKPDKFWADCVGSLGDYCTGNWRPCTTSADCGVCYDWNAAPKGDPNNASSLTPCTTDDDCPVPGEFCGVDCLTQWPPLDGFINFHDITAAVFTFSGMPTVTTTEVPNVDLHGDAGGDANVNPPNYIVNFNDISLLIKAFEGWPYPYADPGDCPDVGTWPPYGTW